MSDLPPAHESVTRLLLANPPRAGSLGITIFGDVISQHGNCVWLGSLVRVMQDFGVNPRQARTALFRLVREGWLSARQSGRRSYYSYTEHGQRLYARAARRIYAVDVPDWDGEWTLVVATEIETALREELRRQLRWQGYGLLGAALFAHPRGELAALRDTLEELDLMGRVLIWRAQAEPGTPLGALVRNAWGLDELAIRFRAFVAMFGALLPSVRAQPPEPRTAFLIRILLVHEYRRILLKSTDLPAALLPPDWPGHAAARCAADIYHAVGDAAARYARSVMQNENGALPPASGACSSRFAVGAASPTCPAS